MFLLASYRTHVSEALIIPLFLISELNFLQFTHCAIHNKRSSPSCITFIFKKSKRNRSLALCNLCAQITTIMIGIRLWYISITVKHFTIKTRHRHIYYDMAQHVCQYDCQSVCASVSLSLCQYDCLCVCQHLCMI